MKILIPILLAIAVTTGAQAQVATGAQAQVATGAQAQKIDKYCEVVFYLKVFATERCNPHIQLGEADSLFAKAFKDTSVVESLKKVNSFNTRTDVLNYMSNLGWTLATSNTRGNNTHFFVFKRSFDPSELKIP
jgi:hypothetical protein